MNGKQLKTFQLQKKMINQYIQIYNNERLLNFIFQNPDRAHKQNNLKAYRFYKKALLFNYIC